MGRPLAAASPLPHGASWQGEALSILVCPPSAIFRLEGRRHGVTAATLPAAGCCLADGAGLLLSIGPDVYLHLGRERDCATLLAQFNAVVDVSSAWAHLAYAGPKAVEVLRKGCAIDLHPRMFPAGACCATGFARTRVVLWRPSMEARYEMLVGRSYARSLWCWLIEAAAQYGAPQRKERLQ
jgi:heterotetrameric sarcosine oxidase gamma subunit